MKVLIVFWRMFQAYLFYPIMIGLFLWLYFTGAHWIFGLGLIIAILIFDRTWLVIAKNIYRMITRK